MASRPSWTLVVEDRFGTITDEYVFDAGELVVGRSRQCDVVLPSENVSREHARLSVEEGRLFVEDAGSSNGLWVGADRIEERTELRDGDVVKVGDFHLRVKGGRPANEARVVHARLVGRSSGAMDQTLEVIESTTLVGRGRDCGLVLVDPSVSRVHSRLLVRPDGTVLVEDVSSANGLFVNDKRVKVWQLSGGDRVRFGSVEFLVELPGSSTIQMRAHSSRFRRWLGAALPWALGLGGLATLVVLLAVFLPRLRSQPEGPEPAPRSTATASFAVSPEPSKPAAPASDPGALQRARALFAGRRMDEARKEVAVVLAQEPANVEAVRLMNRLELEGLAAAALGDADLALAGGRIEEAVQDLFSVPLDSGYAGDAKARMRTLLPHLDRARSQACSGRGSTTFPCIRWTALKAKVEAASR